MQVLRTQAHRPAKDLSSLWQAWRSSPVRSSVVSPFTPIWHAGALPVAHRTASGVRFRFINPYGQGDVSAAGVIPYFIEAGQMTLVLQKEQKLNNGKAVLSAFGGKVEKDDTHWTNTALREFEEETGGAAADVQLRLAIYSVDAPAAQSIYVAPCKYQMMFYTIQKTEIPKWKQLPRNYKNQFAESIEPDRIGQEVVLFKCGPFRNMNQIIALMKKANLPPMRIDLRIALELWFRKSSITHALERVASITHV